MSSKSQTELKQEAVAGGEVPSEPVGRAEQSAGGGPLEFPGEVGERLSDEVIDQLLASVRTEEEIVGPGRGARPADEAAG
jgi:hypothetical protein